MKTQRFLPIGIAWLLATGPAGAAKVYGGSGIGFSNDPSRWVAHILFEKTDKTTVWTKSDTFKGKVVSVQTGDVLTPMAPSAPADQWDLATITVPHTRSVAWCDPAANPDDPGNTDFTSCFGNAKDSKWFTVDLNDLQRAGLRSVAVTVTVKRHDDGLVQENDASGNPIAADDDLIPAVTVFRGRQDTGGHGNWYPNRFQRREFWAWKLIPFAPAASPAAGYASAYGVGAQDSATVSGRYLLRPGNQNYLAIAVGGDARQDTAAPHDVNFSLSVGVYTQDPKTDGIFADATDTCGCEKGQTWWHLAMGHCMSIAECRKPAWKNGPPGHRCQTPAECKTNGGRWACGDTGVACQ